MAHITATGLFLVLLVCSAILGGSTATEHNVTTISTESGGDKQDNANIIKELEKEKRKYLTARKMGGFDVKKDPTKTGQVTETESKLMSTKDTGKKDTGTRTGLSKLLTQPGANQNLEQHSNSDVVMEMYHMLMREYHMTARRRGPINNALPLDDEEP